MTVACRVLRPVDQDAEAHGARGCGNHADTLTCSPRAASYQTSGRSHTAAGVVGHGMLIQGPEGLWHAKHGPVTKICLVCSASAAVRGLNLVRRRLGTGPGATLGPPTPAANLESETAALAPRRKQVAVVAL